MSDGFSSLRGGEEEGVPFFAVLLKTAFGESLACFEGGVDEDEDSPEACRGDDELVPEEERLLIGSRELEPELESLAGGVGGGVLLLIGRSLSLSGVGGGVEERSSRVLIESFSLMPTGCTSPFAAAPSTCSCE